MQPPPLPIPPSPLNGVRDGIGPLPRKLGWFEKAPIAFEKPDWLKQAPDDQMNDVFGAFGKLWKHGRVVWGWVVMANYQLYEPGEGDCPGEILYSLTQDDMVCVSKMPELADRLWTLKTSENPDPSWSEREKEIAQDLASEMAWHAGFRLPENWGPVAREFRLNSVMFHRGHLSDARICHRILPILVLPEMPYHSMVLPERYWTDELRTFLTTYRRDSVSAGSANNEDYRSLREAAYVAVLGPIKSVLHETESRHAHVDVYAIEPRSERDFWTFVTGGMSDHDQPGVDRGCSERIELVLYSKAKVPQLTNCLRNFAHYPFESGQGIANGDTIPLGSHAEAVIGSSRFPVLLFAEAVRPCDQELVAISTWAENRSILSWSSRSLSQSSSSTSQMASLASSKPCDNHLTAFSLIQIGQASSSDQALDLPHPVLRASTFIRHSSFGFRH